MIVIGVIRKNFGCPRKNGLLSLSVNNNNKLTDDKIAHDNAETKIPGHGEQSLPITLWDKIPPGRIPEVTLSD